MTGLAETVPDTDAPVVVRGVFVPEGDAEVDEAAATDATGELTVNICYN
jgi:hypothetical protein